MVSAKKASKTNTKTKSKTKTCSAVENKARAGRKMPSAGRKNTRKSFSEVYDEYLEGSLFLELWQKIGIAFLVVVIAGNVGWLYEVFINLVAHHTFYMKGGNFLPWMNIYAIGALMIIPATYRVRQHPWAIFVIAAIVAGLLELFAGWLVYQIWPGTRYWDYTNEWWGFGHINGFVCPVSAVAFGLGALVLMYAALPFCMYLAVRLRKKTFLLMASVLFSLVMVDELTNLTLKFLDLPTAMDFWRSIGLHYKT